MQVKPKLFAGLCVAALLCLCAAIAVYVAGNRWEAGEIAGEAAFPVLEQRINDVASFELTQGGETLTFTRSGARWTSGPPYQGYEIAANRIAPLIVRLSQADLIEPKTRDPGKYALLALDDPETQGSEARRIVLRDADGAVIMETVLGNKRWDAFGTGKNGSYIRRPGEQRTWLASLDIDPTTEIKTWIQPDFFEIDKSRISSVTVVHEGQEPLRIVRAAGDDPAFELAGMASADARKESAPKPDETAEAYASIALEDLRKLETAPAGADAPTATLETQTGLSVTFRLRKEDGDYWLSLVAEGEGEAAKQASEINDRVKGWEFRIRSWKADRMFRSLSDFVETS